MVSLRGFRLHDLLAFYREAGVSDALVEEAPNRLLPARNAAEPSAGTASRKPAGDEPRVSAPPPPSPASPAPSPRPLAQATVPDGAQVALARERAARAPDLESLRREMEAFEGCNLKLTAKNLVFADGNPSAPLMLVGEAPGRDEDIEGLPFVGRSGQLLDRMLAAIGLDRGSAYIANVIPWRPPGNRTPTPQETEICRPFIERHIELVAPRLLVTLGGPSTKQLLGVTEGILRARGTWRTHRTASGAEILAMPTLHPAYLLRNPSHKKHAWRDLLAVKLKLRELDA